MSLSEENSSKFNFLENEENSRFEKFSQNNSPAVFCMDVL